MLARPSRIVGFMLAAIGFYLLHETLFANPSSKLPNITLPPPGFRIQYPFKQKGITAKDEVKAEAIKKVMRRTWKLYKERAWGFDEVKPISGGHHNSRNGWGSTIIDSMTTAVVMGLSDVFADQYDWVVNKVNFNYADGLVDPFETTIRYLGALISTVDLLEAGMIEAPSPSFRQDILRQATTLANRLGPAFDTPTGMIWPRVNFEDDIGVDSDGRRKQYTSVHLARAGSHWLEYSTLSQLTGDMIYYKNSTRAWNWLVYNHNGEPWPGILESPRSIWTGNPVGSTRTLGAPDDSHYEYLIKAHLLYPNKKSTRRHAKRWLQAMQSARTHLSSTSAKTNPPHAFLLSFSHERYENQMGHLTCFIGGNLLLGAKYLSRPDLFAFGESLIEGCRYSYVSMPTGIGPESWSWTPRESKPGQAGFTGPLTLPQRNFRDKTGIWPTAANYALRPEVVESYFYGWRITGEEKYREWAWDAFNSIVQMTETEWGYSEVADVTDTDKDKNLRDKMESFWSAETLKYLYLIFSDPELCSLDEWVFNTEAHPLKRRF
ncbi:hypothetical protein H072_4428 [Dactylellina haptotyla CBS 200.50]|uniref:alpha-1,2-Mannosidase n=1 Tax=Dactylellina haptotyla (strain CBS 200.50) TaxID=1284197 RepID=S8C214_DACHA|nr:hypothetical protein H072_4428 [Dactylellina haptotyla CBS 200.50]